MTKSLEHNGIKFYVESFEIQGAYKSEIKCQAFTEDGDFALTEIEKNMSIAIMRAIATINKEF